MKHYKLPNGDVFGYDESQKDLISAALDAGAKLMSGAEFDAFKNPPARQEELRIAEIDARLTQIDMESIRPTRALRLNPESEDDLEKLEELEAEAELLRDERRDLTA